jgi:hypothetical protein
MEKFKWEGDKGTGSFASYLEDYYLDGGWMKTRALAIRGLILQLSERVGLKADTQIFVDYVDFAGKSSYQFSKGWTVLQTGDPSDPFFGYYLDGEIKAGFYVACRGNSFRAFGLVVASEEGLTANNNTDGWVPSSAEFLSEAILYTSRRGELE